MTSRAPVTSIAVAVLVAVAAATATSPVALVTAFWVGGGAIASGLRASAPTYAIAGLLIVAVASLVVAAWATVPGIVRGRRRPAIVAVAVITALVILSLTRAWQVAVASWVPRSVALAAMLLALIGLIVFLVRGRTSRAPVVGDPVVGVAPAVAGVLGAYVLVAAVAALPGSGIPQFPRPPWVPQMQGDGAEVQPMAGTPAPQNPALARGEWATIHNDSWMTDAYAQALLPDPAESDVTSFFAGGDCASLLWNDRGEVVAVCVSPTEVRAYVLDASTLAPLAERRLASRALAADALTNFSGGGSVSAARPSPPSKR